MANLSRKGYDRNLAQFNNWTDRYDFAYDSKGVIGKKMCMIGYGVKSFNITMPVICQDYYCSIDQFLIIKDGRIV